MPGKRATQAPTTPRIATHHHRHQVHPSERIGHGQIGHHVGAFTPDISDLLRVEQNEERDNAIPTPSAIVRVRDETGMEIWMAPNPPPAMYNRPEKTAEQLASAKPLISKLFCRIGILASAIALMSSTIAQVYIWILATYYWPLHFFWLIIDGQTFVGAFDLLQYYSGVILAIHPLVMGTWIINAVFCFPKHLLKAYTIQMFFLFFKYFTRGLYFTIVNVIYFFLAIVFVSTISSGNVVKILENAIDKYNLSENSSERRGWDTLQQYHECCGINGREDWIDQRADQDEKIPMSCCIVFRYDFYKGVVVTPLGYREEIEECITYPDNFNTWQNGCLPDYLIFLDKFCAGFAFLQLLSIFLVIVSTFFSRNYYIILQREKGDPNFDYTLTESLMNILCLNLCMTYKKDVDTGKYVIIARHYHSFHRRRTIILKAHRQAEARTLAAAESWQEDETNPEDNPEVNSQSVINI